jgi:hypothetical protein
VSLYAADPRVRWSVARDAHDRGDLPVPGSEELRSWWPRYWFWSLNAWLLYLGPSPGDSPGGPINWARDRYPNLGMANEHFRTYEDGSGFWRRLRAWTRAAFKLAGIFSEDSDAALGISMCGNVLETFAGDARKKINTEDLLRGMPFTMRCIAVIQPRLIVPMEKRLTPLLMTQLKAEGWKVLASGVTQVPAKNQKRYTHYRPAWHELRRDSAELLIAESPQHPSRPNFYDPVDMDRYLCVMLQRTLE